MRWHIEVSMDLQVVGYNPENADMDRPRGEIIGEIFFLRATNSEGDRRSHGGYSSFEEAEAAIADAPMIMLWQEDRPEYGSIAYQKYGYEYDMESESRQYEAERYGFDTRYMIF